MWVHIGAFVITLSILIAWKAGWLKLEGLEDRSGRILFMTVAIGGNLLGLLYTAGSGAPVTYAEGHKLEREEGVSYEEKLWVSVEGENAGAMYIQIPEKEAEEISQQETEETLTESEKQKKELLEAVARYNQMKNDPDFYYLPSDWEGKQLEWKKEGDSSGTLLSALSLFAAMVILVRKAREKQEAWKKRSEQLLMDYPGLVMKFTLLVQAGMTVRKAFQKIALDYKKRPTQESRPAYEEIAAACFEMDSGVSETEAYRRFGERCGQIQYKTFSMLLVQNLQKGSRRLSEMLERESMEAWDERKRKARVMGETAATKLLFPMILMLAVVMAIIMIPAFLSFYG